MDATARDIDRETRRPAPPEADREPFEARVYRASPLGFVATTLAIFVLIYGSYAAIAHFTGRPGLFVAGADGEILLTQVSWIAFVLSLIFTAGTAFNAAGQRRWDAEVPALLAATGEAGEGAVLGLAGGIPAGWRKTYLAMFLAGAIAGLAFNAFMIATGGYALPVYLSSVGLWFLLTSPFLFATGFRAGLDVARRGGAIRGLVRDHLEVDLFRLDRLAVFGRIGLRAARSWMVMAAILLLFVINPNHPDRMFDPAQLWVTGPTVLASVLGGLFLLTSALHPVHAKIRAAKQAELDRIHAEMAKMRDKALAGNAGAASALAGYTDYEVWVNALPEWPVSAGLTTRFSLYVLIPVIPIAGSYVFEKLADQFVAGGGI